MNTVINPESISGKLPALWFPKVVAEVDDAYVKVARIQGSLAWHSHDQEDELFFILKGQLRIELEDNVVELSEGDLYVVPKGVRHNPIAAEECHVLFIERKSTKHTGDVVTENTRSIEEQLSHARGSMRERN